MKSFILALAGLFLLCATSVAQPPPIITGNLGHSGGSYAPWSMPSIYNTDDPIYTTKWIFDGKTWVESTDITYPFELHLRYGYWDPIDDVLKYWVPDDSPFTVTNNGGEGELIWNWSEHIDGFPLSGTNVWAPEAKFYQNGQLVVDWTGVATIVSRLNWTPYVSSTNNTGHWDNWPLSPGHAADEIQITIDPNGNFYDNDENVGYIVKWYNWNSTSSSWDLVDTNDRDVDYEDRDDVQTFGYFFHNTTMVPDIANQNEYRCVITCGQLVDHGIVFTHAEEYEWDAGSLPDLD